MTLDAWQAHTVHWLIHVFVNCDWIIVYIKQLSKKKKKKHNQTNQPSNNKNFIRAMVMTYLSLNSLPVMTENKNFI